MKKKLLMLFATASLVCVSAFGVSACTEPEHTHTFDKQVVSTDYLATDANCTEKAKYFYSCECGEKGTETFESGEALGHSYGAWTSNADGTHTKVCANDATHVVTENCAGGTATCEGKPVCATCEAEYGTALGHDYGAWVSVGNDQHAKTCANDPTHVIIENCHGGTATCTEKAVCDDCGAEHGSTLPHEYDLKFNETKHWYECECGDKHGEGNHIPGSAPTEDDPQVCTECQYILQPALGHVHTLHLTHVPAKPQSCTAEGNTEYYTCECGKWFSDANATQEIIDKTSVVIAKDPHEHDILNYDENQHWYECECGDIKAETVEDHKDGVPTCEEKGECSVCHQKYGTELGHAYGDWTSYGDGTHTGTCANNCGIPKTEGCHGGTPTCEGKPVCVDCETEYGEELGHIYGDWTSNSDGTHTGTCANECGVPKTENCNFVDGECTVCGEVYTVNYYIGGSQDATQAELKLGNEISVYASAYGNNFTPELSIVEGEAVSIEDNKITAIAVGTATVKATYSINGETVEKQYVITVTYDNWEGDAVKYSTLDGKIYFDNQLSKAGIVSIVDATDDSIVYYDGSVVSNVPENTDSKDLTDYTKKAIVEVGNGKKYLIDVVSYTQVITKDTDLAVLVDNSGTETNKAIVYGYYILGNDIERSGDFEGNKATYSYFAGVLDGNGHYIDLQLGTNGLLCGLNDGAEIKDLAILVNVPSTTKNAYILASKDNNLWGGKSAKITDVYCEINVAPSADIGGKGATKFCGETLASGIRYKNFILNLANGIQGMAETGYTRGGVIYGYTNSSVLTEVDGINYVNVTGSINVPSFANSYYINSDYKFVSRWIENGAKKNCTVAENDFALYQEVTTTYGYEKASMVKGVKRYDDFTAMASANNDYSTFNTEVWDLTKGYPVFKSVEKYALVQDIKANTEYYVGGAKDTLEATIENTDTQGISIYANYNTTVYKPILTIVEGEQLVTVENEVIKPVAGALGEVTVKAVYDIQGVAVEKVYTIKVVLPALGSELRYSTLTNELFVENNKFALNEIESIIDLADQTKVYYSNDELTDAVAKNYATEELADVTSAVIVTLENGEKYSSNLVSYTMVINEDTDLEFFKESNYATYSAEGHAYAGYYEIISSKPILRGYYIVNNDIYLSGNWSGNYHEYNNKSGSFGGTFDGDGHVVELKLYSGGIFGALYGATVKNVALVAKDLYADTVTTGRYALIANQTWSPNNDLTKIDNVYGVYDLDVPVVTNYQSWGRYSGLSFIANNGYYIDYTNSILDFSDLEISDLDNLGNYGFVNANINTDTEKGGYRNNSTNNYFITSLPSAGRTLETKSNAYTGNVYTVYGANQTDAYNADITSTFKYQYKGISVYADYTAMKAGNHDYSSYNTDVWTIKQGEVPVFTAYAKYVQKNSVLENTKFYFAGSDSQTETTVENTEGTSIDVYASFNTQEVEPTLAIVDGSVVTVSGRTITVVANAIGSATVKATYEILGVKIEKEYIVNVAPVEKQGLLSYSTLDNKFHLSKELADDQIVKVQDLATGVVYYENNAITEFIPKNTNSNDLTDFTKTVVVTLVDGSNYTTTAISYTKVLTKAEDLLIFNIDDGDSAVSTPKKVEGYYVLGNDIVGTEPLTFKHADMLTAWNNITTGFAGVFDGDGHKVTVTLSDNNAGSEKTGIFGQLQAGAVIKNVAFVDCVINRGVLLFSGAMNNARNVYVQNVYVNMTATTASTYGGSAWYSPGYINVQGVLIDNDTPASVISGGKTAAEILAGDISTAGDNGHGTLFSNTYALNDASRNKGLIVVSESPLVYGRVSSKTTTANDTHAHRIAVGVNEGYQSGATIECPCDTGLLKDHLQIFTLSTVYHYASLLELSNKTSEIAEIITNYSTDYWTITNGYPVFKGLEDRVATDMISSTEYYLGGSKGATEVTLENKAETSIDVYATFNSTDYQPTLSIVEGDTVTVSGNTISVVANATGNTTVKATYVINGVTVEKVYTISVVPEEKEGVIAYSTLDNKFYLPESIKDDEIVEIKEATSGDVYFANDVVDTEKMPQNADSKDLTDYTKKVIVTLADGTNYTITVISYTKVLTKADDLSVFAHEKTTDIVSGYFIVANDITLEGSTWAGNAHYRTWQVSGTFDGVLDGNGHSVELKLNYGGLLGVLAPGSVVKDVAFIVKAMNTTGSNAGNVIANKSNASNDNKLIVENVYVEWDLPENTVLNTAHNGSGQDFGLALFGEQPYYSKISNVVINMTGVTKQTEGLDFRYGALYSKINSASSATWANNVLSNVYVISQDKYFALNRTYSGATINDEYSAVHFASNDTEALAEFKTANATVEKAYAYSGVKRYDSVDDFAKATGNDYSLFVGVWDTTLGYPVFKALKK